MSNDHRLDPSRMIASQALKKIEQLGLRWDPRTYEIFYTYFAGTAPQLGSDIDRILADRGTINQAELDELHRRVLASVAAKTDEVDVASDRLTALLANAVSSIAEAVGQTGEASTQIARAQKNLDPKNPKSICLFAEELVAATSRIQSSNRALQSRLQDSRTEIQTLQDELHAIREISLRDALTELFNRRYFDEKVAKIVNAQGADPVSLLMIDIDHFKSFNDRLGHPMGDQVLRVVAHELQTSVGKAQTVARYGGEEFAVVLEGVGLDEAAELAEQIRKNIMGRDIKRKSTGALIGRLTVSIGVSMLKQTDDLESWIGRADRALYKSKRNGRNRVICEQDDRAQAGEPLLMAAS